MKRPETTTTTSTTTTLPTTTSTRRTTEKNKKQGPNTSCIYHAKKEVALCVLDFPNHATKLYFSVTVLIVFVLL